MSTTSAKPGLLVLTSTYPRYAGDYQPAFVHELTRRLSDRFDIDVLAPHAPGLAAEETLDGVRVHRFRYAPGGLEDLAYDGGILNRLRARPLRWLLVPLYLGGMILAARRLVRQRGHAVIHAHWLLPQGFAALFCRRVADRRVPVLCTLHGGDLYGLDVAWAHRLRAAILKRLDAITVVSEAMRTRVTALGRDLPDSAVIPMGTDLTNRFTPDTAVPREPFLLFVGRLVPKKGVDLLLRAFARLAQDHPDLSVTIAGDGPERPSLETLAAQLGVRDQVRFLGSISNAQLPDLYRRATVAIFPFRREVSGDQEGFGLVVVEAMGCGCPVIVGDVPAIRDIVGDGDRGLLTPSDDADRLYGAIRRVLAEPANAADLGARARGFVASRFDWNSTGSAMSKVVARLAAEYPI